MAGQPQDARIAGPEHLDLRSAAQSELFELVDVVGMAEDPGDAGAMAGREVFQGDGRARRLLRHGGRAVGGGRINSENQSQYQSQFYDIPPAAASRVCRITQPVVLELFMAARKCDIG